MARRHLAFECEGTMLVGTLDQAGGSTGLLLVTGGNETRAGAFCGQSRMAASIADKGYPVFRFDRRGTGDSEGENKGFRSSGPDIAAAISAFRQACPHLKHIAGLGNCDAATSLMLAQGSGLDALILSNPWTIEQDSGAPSLHPQAVRARYAEKLRNPAELLRLVTGKVSFSGLVSGVKQALSPSPAPTSLAQEIITGLAGFEGEVSILLAGRDRTAQIFDACWDKSDKRIKRCPEASHAFVEVEANIWLLNQIVEVLAKLESNSD